MRPSPFARVLPHFLPAPRRHGLALATVLGVHALVAGFVLCGRTPPTPAADTRALRVALLGEPTLQPTAVPFPVDPRLGRVRQSRYVPEPPAVALASRLAPAQPAPAATDTTDAKDAMDATPARATRLAAVEVPTLQSVSENCSIAALIGRPAEYPAAAVLAGLKQGRVVVEFEALPDSRVRVLKVEASDQSFTPAALHVIQQLHCRAGQYRQAFNYAMTD